MKNNWILYFCELQKVFYRIDGKKVQKLIADEWTNINVNVSDCLKLKWTNLGKF